MSLQSKGLRLRVRVGSLVTVGLPDRYRGISCLLEQGMDKHTLVQLKMQEVVYRNLRMDTIDLVAVDSDTPDLGMIGQVD